MNEAALRELLLGVRGGSVTPEAALESLRSLPYADLGYARVDHHRALRQGVAEVVFGASKTAREISGIVGCLRAAGHNVLVTRVEPECADQVRADHPELVYHPRSKCLTLELCARAARLPQPVVVMTAGTSDQAVAEEACLTLELSGERVERIADVGVAGIHRLLAELPRLKQASGVICIAGMEGTLPSVVGGLVSCPVVAVPTSVGYGAALGGIAALLGMLTSCAAGVTVVNIDNGFGAAMALLRIASRVERDESARAQPLSK